MLFSKINLLSIAANKGYNRAMAKARHTELLPSLYADTTELENVLVGYLAKADEIRKDPLLSDRGRREYLETLQDKTIEALQRIDRSVALTQGVDGLHKAVEGSIRFERDKNAPVSTIVSELQAWEIRQHMEKNPDGIADAYVEACGSYSADKEQFLSALDKAPWPIRLLSEETIQAGREALAKSIAPEQLQQLELGQLRQAAYADLIKTAFDIVDRPEKVLVQVDRQTKLTPDGGLEPLQPVTA